jgi:transposase
MVFSIITYLKDLFSSPFNRRPTILRKEVAKACGISERTVSRVKAEADGPDGLSNHKAGGARRSLLTDDNVELLHEFVRSANNKGRPLSIPKIRVALRRKGVFYTRETLRRHLHSLGYHFGIGERRNILHETNANIAFRGRYLRYRLLNLNRNQLPTRPEVFLDESYCHVDHTQRRTWVPKNGIVYEGGRGKMLVIFGAIVVFRNGNTNQLKGEIVPSSLHIWDPSFRAPSTQRSRGRPRANAEEWRTIPLTVQEANIAPDRMDYHGNFNADIFENLFTKLCEQLQQSYGACEIHMDGARYHKRRTEALPTSSARRQAMVDWLTEQDIPFDESLTRPELYQLIKENKAKIPFACVKIAEEYGHILHYTPPYHCELQPIEKVNCCLCL